MIRHTNINIQSDNNQFIYYIEYEPDCSVYKDVDAFYTAGESDIYLYTEQPDHPISTRLVRNINIWKYENIINKNIANDEGLLKFSNFQLYFPEYSIDLYNDAHKYALSANIYINGYKVTLLSTIVERLEATASDTMVTFQGHNYYEYCNIHILDPYDIMFGDGWKAFRESLGCFSPRSIGSTLYVSLQPVEDSDGCYISSSVFSGGQSFIDLANHETLLSIGTSFVENYNGVVAIKSSINLPKEYIKDGIIDLNRFFKDTYNTNITSITSELAIKDKNTGYRLISPTEFNEQYGYWVFARDRHPANNILDESKTLCFKDWSGWKEGINIVSRVSFNTEDGTFTVFSEPMPLTKEVFKFFVGDLGDAQQYVNIKNKDTMKVYELNAINKIEQKIIQVDRPDDSKSNIIKPVFFRAQEVGNIILHPAVIEQISLNLDSYKSKVSTFMIKIEGVSFGEMGRTNSNIIFKIIGNKLPNKVKSGTYYITDTEGVMVTSGKYTYEE